MLFVAVDLHGMQNANYTKEKKGVLQRHYIVFTLHFIKNHQDLKDNLKQVNTKTVKTTMHATHIH